MTSSERVSVRETADIVTARGRARHMAMEMGFDLAAQVRLATAVSELARNALQYAGGGICEIREARRPGDEAPRVCVVIEDHGPGIADLAKAMADGYSTSGGLGAGLPGTRRLMDEFEIDSRPGLTRVTIAMIKRFR